MVRLSRGRGGGCCWCAAHRKIKDQIMQGKVGERGEEYVAAQVWADGRGADASASLRNCSLVVVLTVDIMVRSCSQLVACG